MRDLLRILGLWRSRTGWLLTGALISLASLATAIGLMAVAGASIGVAVATGVLVAPVLLRTLGVTRVLLRYVERLVTHAATFRALADLRVWFFRRLAAGSAGGLGFRQAGDVLSRLVGDIEALDGLYLRIVIPLAGALLLLPVLVVVLSWRAPALAVGVGALFVMSALVLPWFAARATADAGTRLAGAAGGLRIAVLDALTGLREVRAFSAEGRMVATMQAREAALLTAQHELARRTALAGALAFLCAQGSILAILAASGTNPARVVAATFFVIAAFEVASGLPRAGALAGHATAAARRVLAIADQPNPVPDPPQPAPPPRGYALRFEGVCFRWLPDRPPVFDGLTLDIPQASRVALIGPSGGGKSTLAALALKVAAPQQGRVMFGGIDTATLTAASVHARIAWLSQTTHLFDDTIQANLLLARPDADEAALWAALDAAQIGELVRALPDRLETWVGEGGRRFSSGQGRRLALARALLSEAPILILDEPCAGLDAETERDFLMTLNDAVEGRTVVLITHRLIGVERLDRLWRLSDGKAVAAAA